MKNFTDSSSCSVFWNINLYKPMEKKVLLLVIFLNIYVVTCLADNNPGCSLKSGNSTTPLDSSVQNGILKALQNHGLYDKRFSYTDENKDYEYHFAVCADVSKIPKVSLVRRSIVQGTDEDIGRRNATSVAGVDGEWVMLYLGPGDNGTHFCTKTPMSSSVMFLCDRQDTQFKLVYEDTEYCKFLFELRTPLLCGPAPGMSGWSVFFIICLVGFLLYFIVGALYFRFTKGAKGVEQIPHRAFWVRIGNTLADGCSAVCRCDQYGSDSIDHIDSNHHSAYSGGPYSGGYSPIGEATPVRGPNSLDRDTALLNP